MEFKFKSLIQLFDYFQDEKTCFEFLGQQIWAGTPACPHCGSIHVYQTKTRSKSIVKQGVPEYRCAEKGCCKNFSATVGTIFEASKLPLRTWFAAIWLCTTSSKGISSLNLSKQLGITQKSAWFVLSRVREMFASTQPDMLLTGIVEVDETYVGGKEKNKSKKVRAANKKAAQALNPDKTSNIYPIDTKTAVLGILQRDGIIRVQPMVAASKEVLLPILDANISKDATVVTDGLPAYKKLGDAYKLHVVVNHANDEWTKGEFSTNGIESFWATFKRGIVGVYHQTSVKHLHRYCNEYSYRYNQRNENSNVKFAEAISRVVNARITYNSLIGK
jgi:transposase-like protein